MWSERIVGPPGTGKTTQLISRVEEELHQVAPEAIGYYSFTRAAANVARRRALDAFPELGSEDLPHFRTIHSECFKLLECSRDRVMAGKNLRDFARECGYELSQTEADEEEAELKEVALRTQGDWLLFFHNWRCSMMLPLEQAYTQFWDLHADALPEHWSPALISGFERRYSEYKEAHGLMDFNDMLLEVLKQRLRPDLKVLVKDEAQDSSPLLYQVLDLFLEGVERHYLAGDPCQAIYVWQGASPELFDNRSADQVTVLSQSWRLPREVHRFARRILATVPYQPRDAEGIVKFSRLSDYLETLDNYEGSVFILVRNLYLLNDVTDDLYRWGVPFYNLRGPSPFRSNDGLRLLALMRFMRGEPVSVDDLHMLLDKIPQAGNLVRGTKARIKSMAKDQAWLKLRLEDLRDRLLPGFFNDTTGKLGIPQRELGFYTRVIRHQGEEALLERPRVTIGTIHSVKGMEADWVVLLTDMTRRTFEGNQKRPLDEARVWYTGATRARQGLFLVPPQGLYSWQWPALN